MRVWGWITLLLLMGAVAVGQVSGVVFDDSVLGNSVKVNAVTVASESSLTTVTGTGSQADWGELNADYNMVPRTSLPPGCTDTVNDWIRWSARWGYDPNGDPPTICVEVFWVGKYHEIMPQNGRLTTKYKTVVKREYPGWLTLPGSEENGFSQVPYVRWNGVECMRANKPSGHGYCSYFYITKMTLKRLSYGQKSVSAVSSGSARSASY